MKFDWRRMLVLGLCVCLSACGGGPTVPAAKVTEPAKEATKPDSGNTAEQPVPNATQAAAEKSGAISLKYVTDDVIAAAVIRPKQIWESQFVQAVVKAADPELVEREIQRIKGDLGLDPRTLTEIQVLADAGMLQGEPSQRPAKSADEMKLQQIGLAFHNYHDAYTKFPAVDGPGAGMPGVKSGLSWRVYLLPYLDNGQLYSEFHLDEPWDSEHNKKLIDKMPDIYETAGVDEKGKTAIQVFTGAGTPFQSGQPSALADFQDGTSNTILAVIAGADQAGVWTKPEGLPFDAQDPWKAVGK
ncbi:MAG TPA: DUF1559 domain-containing protein, partial [Planctomycetaceae bacterium]|nr:DUF1559 domain-containing protein [Planctomycetaceae bacterium]